MIEEFPDLPWRKLPMAEAEAVTAALADHFALPASRKERSGAVFVLAAPLPFLPGVRLLALDDYRAEPPLTRFAVQDGWETLPLDWHGRSWEILARRHTPAVTADNAAAFVRFRFMFGPGGARLHGSATAEISTTRPPFVVRTELVAEEVVYSATLLVNSRGGVRFGRVTPVGRRLELDEDAW